MNKHLTWVLGLIAVILIIAGTLIYLNSHPYIIKMDENTRDALKSMHDEQAWICPVTLEQGNYTLFNGYLVSPSGIQLNCSLVGE